MQNFEAIQFEVQDSIAEIVLNRPDQRNALNNTMVDELLTAVRTADADDSVHVVLIRANGPAFCAGNDLKERASMDIDALRDRRVRGQQMFSAIEEITKPCVAIVHGAAVAAGCEIALSCDFILAGDAATFRYPVGVRGSLGDTLRLPRIVGKAAAKELLFSGRRVSAEDALHLRLVNRVVPTAKLLEEARSLAAAIAENDPQAMKLTKRAINTGATATAEDVMKMEQGAINAAIAFQSERSGVDRKA